MSQPDAGGLPSTLLLVQPMQLASTPAHCQDHIQQCTGGVIQVLPLGTPVWFQPQGGSVDLGSVAGPAPTAEAAAELYAEWVALLLLCEHLARAQEVMKRKADRHRQGVNFKTGDLVMLSTCNIATTRLCRKLDYKQISPFQVLDQINPVTFRLQLPASLQIHPVFHTSLLSPYRENTIRDRGSSPPPLMPWVGVAGPLEGF